MHTVYIQEIFKILNRTSCHVDILMRHFESAAEKNTQYPQQFLHHLPWFFQQVPDASSGDSLKVAVNNCLKLKALFQYRLLAALKKKDSEKIEKYQQLLAIQTNLTRHIDLLLERTHRLRLLSKKNKVLIPFRADKEEIKWKKSKNVKKR